MSSSDMFLKCTLSPSMMILSEGSSSLPLLNHLVMYWGGLERMMDTLKDKGRPVKLPTLGGIMMWGGSRGRREGERGEIG